MPITASLQASARSAYRSLFRAASITFNGDDRVLNAFRDKTRSAYREGRSLDDEKEYEKKINLAREVAQYLRKNIVQGRKEGDVWRLQFRSETELGDNASIKNPANMTSQQKSRGSKFSGLSEPCGQRTQRFNLSELKRLRQKRVIPHLSEEHIEESFVRGSGPGGQSINKTENCVQILHKPTGIRVSCQETRSLELNRRIARKSLIEKLDQLQNPGLSRADMRRARMNERDRQKRKKRRKKEKLHKLINIQEALDDS